MMEDVKTPSVNSEGKKSTTKPFIDRSGCVAFGKRLTEAREAAGHSQSSLARLLGKTRSAVGQWELGFTYPAVDFVPVLADALRSTPEYLLYGVSSNNSPSRMVEAIPLIDKVDGKERVEASVVLPKDTILQMGLKGTERLRAVTVFHDGEIEGIKKGDIVIVNTDDKDIRGAGPFVLDNYETTAVGVVQTVPGSKNKMMHVRTGDYTGDMEVGKLPIVGRIISTVLVGRVPN